MTVKKNIIILTDYKNNFGSKWDGIPYRSGVDKVLLKNYFVKLGYAITYIRFSDFNHKNHSRDSFIIYTSSEDINYHYKDYIEDIVLNAQESGYEVIPEYKFLRANNNKVFMELLKEVIFNKEVNNLMSKVYGTFEDIQFNEITYPVVVKSAAGAMSTGVFLAKNNKELASVVKKISRVSSYINDIKDVLRPYKHKGYIPESLYRKKFIIQEFIPNLKSDYKVLVFGDKYYVFERPVRKNDFRASGSGNKNYIYGSKVKLPKSLLTFAKNTFDQAKVPQLSIDIAFDGKIFYVIEFQALHFGTVGHVKSDGYYKINNSKWLFKKEKLDFEQIFAESIVFYLNEVGS